MVGIPAIDGEWGYDEDALNPIFGDGFYLYGEQTHRNWDVTNKRHLGMVGIQTVVGDFGDGLWVDLPHEWDVSRM